MDMLLSEMCIKNYDLYNYFRDELSSHWAEIGEQIRRKHSIFPRNEYFEQESTKIGKLDKVLKEWYHHKPKLIDLMEILVSIELFSLANDLDEFAAREKDKYNYDQEKWEAQKKRIKEKLSQKYEPQPTTELPKEEVTVKHKIEPIVFLPPITAGVQFINKSFQNCLTKRSFTRLIKQERDYPSTAQQDILNCFLEISALYLPIKTFAMENVNKLLWGWLQENGNSECSVQQLPKELMIPYSLSYPGIMVKNCLFSTARDKDIIREAMILQRINHPNIVQIAGLLFSPRSDIHFTSTLEPNIYSYIDVHLALYKHGVDHLENVLTNKPISIRRMPHVVMQLALALQYLHSDYPYPIYHGNVLMEHVLVDSECNHIRLCGFGGGNFLDVANSIQNYLVNDIYGFAGVIGELVKFYNKNDKDEAENQIFNFLRHSEDHLRKKEDHKLYQLIGVIDNIIQKFHL